MFSLKFLFSPMEGEEGKNTLSCLHQSSTCIFLLHIARLSGWYYHLDLTHGDISETPKRAQVGAARPTLNAASPKGPFPRKPHCRLCLTWRVCWRC